MTVDFNEIAVKNGYKEFLFVAVTEEGEIVAHYIVKLNKNIN